MENRSKRNEGTTDYWLSYSDLMAGVLLVFMLFLFTAILNYNDEKVALNEAVESNKVLTEKLRMQELQIEKLTGLRADIINELKRALEDAGVQVNVDEKTGDIMLDSGVFFGYDKYTMKSAGKEFLNGFLTTYLDVLLGYEDLIAEIIIEGHTDSEGDYLYNLELSQKRALSVSKYIYSNEFDGLSSEKKETLMTVLTSNGKSFGEPIVENGEINDVKSRRVEFSFRLKDDEVIEDIRKIIEGE